MTFVENLDCKELKSSIDEIFSVANHEGKALSVALKMASIYSTGLDTVYFNGINRCNELFLACML